MKYVVTGGAGFIGSNIVDLLAKNEHEIIIIDNLNTGELERLDNLKGKFEFYKEDIRNKEKLKIIIKNADGIFHQAALTLVTESFLKKEEYFDVNVSGTKNLFEIASELQIKIIFASSSSVYGNVKNIPIKENDKLNPINPYGETKVEKEKLATYFSKMGLSVIGLRYFNVFGKGQTGTYAGVITQFMRQLSENKSPKIFGNGSQIRDFIFVKEIAEANLKAMESNCENGFFNVGTGVSVSILELANLMIKIYDKKVFPEFDKLPQGDVEKSLADINLIKEKIGWKSKISLEEGLRELIGN